MTVQSNGGLMRDQAYHRLRTAIVSGRLRPGTKLVMDDLAADFGLSQTPVREAVARLVTEGVVERRTRSTHVVKTHSAQEARDLVEVQSVLVMEMYRITLPKLSRSDVARLRALNDAAVAARTDLELAVALDAFYENLYDLCPNHELVRLRDRLRDRLLMALREHWPNEVGAVGNSVHDLMLTRLEAGDVDGALGAMADGWADFGRAIGIVD